MKINVFRDVIFMELKVTVGNLIEIAANIQINIYIYFLYYF